MNRQERRKIQRETKQEMQEYNSNVKWYENLPNNKKAFIRWMIEQGVIKNEDITMAIIDECFQAAMISELDLDIKSTEKIINKTSEFMVEMKSILENQKGEYLKMIKDEKMKHEIKEEVKKLLQDGSVMSKGVQNLRNRKEYNKISVKDMTILWAEAKEELKAEKEATTKQQVIQSHVEGELVATLAMEGEHGFEIAPRKITLDKTGIKINDGFKINKIELEKNGRIYIKDSEGVKLGDKLYKDITDVKHAQEVLESSTKVTEDNINKKIIELTKELEETRSKKKQELEKYAEIEQILAM